MENEEKEGFDILVTHRDPQSGAITRINPYNRIVTGEARQVLWERPKQSGNVFNKKGEPYGRWIRDAKTGKGKHDPLAAHVYVEPEMSSEDKAKQALHERDERITELERELKSIKTEAQKQNAPKKAASGKVPSAE